MGVSIKNLTKNYSGQLAVNDVSFEAKPGEILGFLGPNGAGKSTTMKIITCFIPQTSGQVEVCGLDTQKASLEVRRQIGYLPEHNPLYKEMYVREYLTFVGRANKVSNARSRITDMIEMTGLGKEQHKKIQTLSKGYRQRVGLAQAMLHDPKVLILDEPTSGLDPNQLAEIRALIKTLGKEKTVIFSTHIMQEVQALCDRVLIINEGKIAANDSIETLQQKVTGREIINVEFLKAPPIAELLKIKGVGEVKNLGQEKVRLFVTGDREVRRAIFEFAVNNKYILLGMEKEVSTVEDVFKHLTK